MVPLPNIDAIASIFGNELLGRITEIPTVKKVNAFNMAHPQ
jgi:hypothetical protein